MKTIKIFGHKAPDTDSICSAIIYAWYLNNIRQRPASPCRLGEINPETEFVLKKFGYQKPRLLEAVEKDDRIIIVDTNNLDELIDLGNSVILEVIDHHKLSGGINTIDPINFTLRKTCSTASVIYLNLNARGIKDIPREIAGLIISAIISDSVNFTSPTTTEVDVTIAKKLARKFKINTKQLAEEMFDAKSNLSKYTAEEIVTLDSKVFDIKDKKYRISVVETNKPESVLSKRGDLQKAINMKWRKEKVDAFLFFIVDILKKESLLLNEDDFSKNIIREAFTIEKETEDGVLLPGVISRKKQIIPALAS